MRPDWEKGWRGALYASGRRLVPLSWRRMIRRRFPTERLLGIRKPEIEVPAFAFDASAVRPGGPDVLFLPVIAWSYRRQRPQQLAEALGRRGRRVFYGALAGPGEPKEATGVAPGVTLIPIAGVKPEDPGDRRLAGEPLRLALQSVDEARTRYAFSETAVIVQTPFWTPLAEELSRRYGWKIVYDCLDEHAGFATNRRKVLAQDEEDLASRSDLVVATSPVLVERLASRAETERLGSRAGVERLASRPGTVRLLPNACDEALFREVPDPPAGRRDLTVGYVGAVDDWFDSDLLEELARLRPRWRFEIVGGFEGTRRPFASDLPNVTFHGERPHRELPSFRERMDVEIIPFRLTSLTHAVDPVKLYEAAAAGRGVVATPMRSLEALAGRGVLRLARTAPEFAAAIEATAAEEPDAVRRRREFARENTWDRRGEDLERWIGELFADQAEAGRSG